MGTDEYSWPHMTQFYCILYNVLCVIGCCEEADQDPLEASVVIFQVHFYAQHMQNNSVSPLFCRFGLAMIIFCLIIIV